MKTLKLSLLLRQNELNTSEMKRINGGAGGSEENNCIVHFATYFIWCTEEEAIATGMPYTCR